MEKTITLEAFLNAYKKAIQSLYTTTEAKQYHLEPANDTSFHSTIFRKAGLVYNRNENTVKAYTLEDLTNVVKDTNEKYEEYDKGQDYSDTVRSKGKLRYVALSDVFYTALNSLGLTELANQLKYVSLKKDEKEPETKTDAQVLEETLYKVGVKKEDTKVHEAIARLNEAVKRINEFIGTIHGVPSDEDKKKLVALKDTLEVVIEDGKRFAHQKDLDEAMKNANDTFAKIIEIQEDKSSLKQEKQEVPKMKDTKQAQNIEEMIPAVLEAIPAMIQRGVKASEELTEANNKINELRNKVEELEKQLEETSKSTELPEDDEELFNIAKEAVNKIGDKTKLKDLGMVIMMKAL